MHPRPEQVRDIAVAVGIKTIGGACQAPQGQYQNIKQMYQTTFEGLGHETIFHAGYSGVHDDVEAHVSFKQSAVDPLAVVLEKTLFTLKLLRYTHFGDTHYISS